MKSIGVLLISMVASVALADKQLKEPIYTLTLPAAVSNSFNNLPEGVTFTKTVDEVTSATTYEDFFQAESGTLVKEGPGWLDIDAPISNWGGQIHINDGVVRVCVPVGGLGSAKTAGIPTDDDATFVKSGATLLMDSSYQSNGLRAERKKIVFEGDGFSGLPSDLKGALICYQRGALPTGKNQSWWFGTLPTLSGDATLGHAAEITRMMFLSDPSPSMMNLGGHTLTITNLIVNSPSFNHNNTTISNGTIIASGNFDYHMQNSGATFASGEDGALILTNRACLRYEACGGVVAKDNWTLRVDDPRSYLKVSGTANGYGYATTNSFAWYGPVLLNYDYVQRVTVANQYSLTYGGPVSGVGGFRNYNAAVSTFWLHLLNPNNTFEGGVALTNCTVVLHNNGALPANGGALTLKDSNLYLCNSNAKETYTESKAKYVNGEVEQEATCRHNSLAYTLPAFNFEGAGEVRMVSGAANDDNRQLTFAPKGKWNGAVTKTGEGKLMYDAPMGGDLLDIQGGSVSFTNTTAVGLIKSLVQYGSTGAAALNFYNSNMILTNEVMLTPDMAYARGAAGEWGPATVVVYEGYVWNRTDHDVKWTFAGAINTGIKVFFDDDPTPIISAGNRGGKKTVTATPGSHHIVIRMYTTASVGPVIENYATGACKTSWPANVGFLWDPLGRDSEDGKNDYVHFEDPGDGSVITYTSDGLSPENALPNFKKVKLGAGTYLDLNGNLDYVVDELEGCGEIRNSSEVKPGVNLTVNDKLSITADRTSSLTIKGTLNLGGTIEVNAENLSGTETFTLLTAKDGITGMPDPESVTVNGSDKYAVQLSKDGKTLNCVYVPQGLILMIK